MDESTVVLKARNFVRSFDGLSFPVPLDLYLSKVGAKLSYQTDLTKDESGYSVPIRGQWHIVVNSNHLEERQRFTICHEIAHLYLVLPTDHAGKSDLQRYFKRPKNEIYCDVFAAETLLPSDLFRPLVNESIMGFQSVVTLARDFKASWTATASRFAALNQCPCAFVMGERGIIRYTVQSQSLREVGAWVQVGYRLPPSSIAAKGKALNVGDVGQADPTEWFEDWNRGGTLKEETRYIPEWDRTLSLLWFEEDYLPPREGCPADSDVDHDPYCRELDGNLPWPDRAKKR